MAWKSGEESTGLLSALPVFPELGSVCNMTLSVLAGRGHDSVCRTMALIPPHPPHQCNTFSLGAKKKILW